MAAGDLTTIANVKAWINVTSSTDDVLLTRLLSAVSIFIQSSINRVLASAVYTDMFDGNGACRQMMANYPVTAVSTVTIDGQVIPQATGPTAPGWYFDSVSVLLRGGYRFNQDRSSPQNVTISYTGGFATVPSDIEQAALEIIALRYAERLRPGVNSKSIAGENITFSPSNLSDAIKDVLNQYRKYIPV